MAIASANREVQKELTCDKKRRGQYNKYTDQERAEIAGYAVRNGVKSASINFSRQYRKRVRSNNYKLLKKYVYFNFT